MSLENGLKIEKNDRKRNENSDRKRGENSDRKGALFKARSREDSLEQNDFIDRQATEAVIRGRDEMSGSSMSGSMSSSSGSSSNSGGSSAGDYATSVLTRENSENKEAEQLLPTSTVRTSPVLALY